jgi:hypothetical protein
MPKIIEARTTWVPDISLIEVMEETTRRVIGGDQELNAWQSAIANVKDPNKRKLTQKKTSMFDNARVLHSGRW